MADSGTTAATLDRTEGTATRAAVERRAGRRKGPENPYHNWRSPKVLTSAASGSLLVLGWLVQWAGGPARLAETCFLAAILSGAFYFGRKALADLLNRREIGSYSLM